MNSKLFFGILVIVVIAQSTQSRRFILNQKLWSLLGKREPHGKSDCVCEENVSKIENPEMVEPKVNCLGIITGTKEWVANGCWKSTYMPYPY